MKGLRCADARDRRRAAQAYNSNGLWRHEAATLGSEAQALLNEGNVSPHLVPQPFVKWASADPRNVVARALFDQAGKSFRNGSSVEPGFPNMYETVRPEDAPAALMRAYAAAVLPPAGPVFLSIPMDDCDRPCPRLPQIRTVSATLPADTDTLRPVIDALAGADSPALIIGGAVDRSGGWDHAVTLAEKLRCAVVGRPGGGRPGFPETHRLYRGTLPPAIGPLGEALAGHDVVVVIGAPVFRYYPYIPGEYLPVGTRLFQITDDPSEAARAPVGQAVLADPGRSCAVLASALPAAQRNSPTPRASQPPVRPAQITAEWLYRVVHTVRPPDSVIVQESLSTAQKLREQIPTARSRSFFSMSSGVLGFGLPAAVGVALAERDEGSNRKVICIVGDGAANYVIQALWTAVQQQLPILFIIPRNGAYNILKSFAELLQTPGVPGLDLPGLDFVALAQGYGCGGERVTNPEDLEEAVGRGIGLDRTHPIEVTIDSTVPPLI